MKRYIKAVFETAAALVAALAVAVAALPAAAATKASVAFQKSSRSEYVENSYLNVTEQLLWSFDQTAGGSYAVDASDSTEGDTCGKVTLSEDNNNLTVFQLSRKFAVNAGEMHKVTFKLDIWVNDMKYVVCDHEAGYPRNDYTHSGTFYWRINDRMGREHAINATVVDNNGKAGWQTMEFTLLHDNGKSSKFDYSYITSARLTVNGRAGLEVRVDNLRACYYSNEGYVLSDYNFPEGCRVISDCEADSLDGAVITEWYGTGYDFKHQKFGRSCLSFTCSNKDDYRIFFGGFDMPLTYSKDYICFWVWVPEGAKLSSWFLEANEVQDTTEYENPGASVHNITKYAVDGFKYGEWNLIQIPLSALQRNNAGESITLHHFRMVPATSGKDFTMYFDNIYLCNAEQAKAAAAEYRNPSPAPAITFSKPDYIASIPEVSSRSKQGKLDHSALLASANAAKNSGDSSQIISEGGVSPVIYIVVAVAVVAVAAVAVLVTVKAKAKKKAPGTEIPDREADSESTPEE